MKVYLCPKSLLADLKSILRCRRITANKLDNSTLNYYHLDMLN